MSSLHLPFNSESLGQTIQIIAGSNPVSPDLYAAMARYYDAENADLVDDLPAYLHLAGQFGGTVLDVGCGTGRVAFFLARHGISVTGIDLSPAMLKLARRHQEQYPDLTERLAWLAADIARLSLTERFDLAIFAYNGFMHLLNQEAQIAALQGIVRHLNPRGGVVLDLPNPIDFFRADDTAGLVLERVFPDAEPGHTVMQQSIATLDRARQMLDVTWIYDRISPDGTLKREMIPVRLRYTMAAEACLLLARAGLEQVELFGDYDFNPYEEQSPRLFIVARRA